MNKKSKVLLVATLTAAVLAETFAVENWSASKEGIGRIEFAKTSLKSYSISEETITDIKEMAMNCGEEAAKKVNELSGNDFSKAVNEVLASYYEEEDLSQLAVFEKKVDSKAAPIVEQYKEAAIEREKEEELSYEANTAILMFGSDTTEDEIERIVEDGNGKCEYIYECSDGTYMVKVNTIGMTSKKAAELFDKYSETISSELNGKVEQCIEASSMINDPYRYNLYYLEHLQVGDAWQYINGRGHSKVKVAVIDGDGVDINSNRDLTNVSNKNESVCFNSDGSYYQMIYSNANLHTGNMHMINCASLVAGQSNNGVQIAGVAAGTNNDIAEIVNVAIPLTVDMIARGVDYAREKGCKVVNLSLFHEGSYDYEKAAIDRFINAGGTVVAGAGNNGGDLNGFPSDYNNVVSVIATNPDKTRRGTSNFGWECNVCAPGTDIYVAGPGDATYITNGTSMASPIVAGVVAMMYSVNSGLNAGTVMDILQNTATDLGDAGRDYYYGYGLVNAYRAVTTVGGGTTQQPTTQAPTTQQQVDGPQEVFGQLITSPGNNLINVVWGSNTTMEPKGQRYNVYVDGQKVYSEVVCGSYTLEGITPGTHTVKITAVYNGKETGGVSGEVTVNGAVQETTTTKPQQDQEGYVSAGQNWTELGSWSVYFASGWGNDPTGMYRDGGAYNNFGIKITKASGAEWGVQLKTKEMSLPVGKNYTLKVKVNTNMAVNSVRLKEEKTEVSNVVSLANGENEIVINFVTQDITQFVIDLGLAPADLKMEVTSFELINNDEVVTTETPTTQRTYPDSFDAYNKIEAEDYAVNQGGVIDINASVSNGKNMGGIMNGTQLRYDNVIFDKDSKGIEICYSSKLSDAQGNAEIYVDSLENKVGTVVLNNTGTDWNTYQILKGELDEKITAGSHTVYVKFVTTGTPMYVANVDYYRFVSAEEYIKTIEGGIEINGFQLRHGVGGEETVAGIRTVYSVDSKINGLDVVSSGLIYSIDDFTGGEDIFIDSTNKYVHSYESTQEKGKLPVIYAESDIATSYAMTMKIRNHLALEYTSTWRVKAYAKLSDGSYVYTKAYTYTIFDIADEIYKGSGMPTQAGNDFIYENILKRVDSNYVKINF